MMHRPLFAFLLLILTSMACAQKHQGKIIDVHFHSRYVTDYGATIPPNPVTGYINDAVTNEELLKRTLAILKQNHVIRIIASGTLERNSDFEKADPSLVVSSLEYPDRQNDPLPDTTTFKKLYAKGAFAVFGELGLQYEGKTLGDSSLAPYLKICERLGIPVALHTGQSFPNTPYTCCPNFRIKYGNPLELEEVLIRYPHLKVQLMHMGHPFLEETKALLNVYPQVYVDISAIDWLVPVKEFHNYLHALMVAGFGKRIMYGSDQMAWIDAIPLSIKNVESAAFLSDAEKNDIFYNNAVRFYNLHIK